MPTACFRFHADLNDFLPVHQRETLFPYAFESHQSVKHLIESLGVPHTEVGQITSNGAQVDFGYRPREGDQVEVFPLPLDEPGADDLAPEPRFVLDNHLGKLAAYLRMLGFDALYNNHYQDEELAYIASQEGRILLTRDRRLLMRKAVTLGYCVRATTPDQQAREVLARFHLAGSITPFRRCLRCNGPLQPVAKEAVLDRLEPLTRQYYNEFHQCACGQVYWKGSHYERMNRLVKSLREEACTRPANRRTGGMRAASNSATASPK